jgi:FkbM family methyltransferase
MLKSVTVNGTTIVVHQDGYEGYWMGVEAGRWEPETFRALDRLLRRDWRMVDIGAWIGPLTLYAARKCRSVDSYECDPVALRALRRNLDENHDICGKVTLYEFALGEEDGFITLYSRTLGNSESSMLRRHERDGEVLECLQSFTCGVRDVRKLFGDRGYASDDMTFVKIDIEGAEFSLVGRLRPLISESRCVWCISVHELNVNPTQVPAAPVRAAELVRLLDAFAALNWFDMRLQPLVKADVMSAIMSGQWPIHQTFLFSHRDALN